MVEKIIYDWSKLAAESKQNIKDFMDSHIQLKEQCKPIVDEYFDLSVRFLVGIPQFRLHLRGKMDWSEESCTDIGATDTYNEEFFLYNLMKTVEDNKQYYDGVAIVCRNHTTEFISQNKYCW